MTSATTSDWKADGQPAFNGDHNGDVNTSRLCNHTHSISPRCLKSYIGSLISVHFVARPKNLLFYVGLGSLGFYSLLSHRKLNISISHCMIFCKVAFCTWRFMLTKYCSQSCVFWAIPTNWLSSSPCRQIIWLARVGSPKISTEQSRTTKSIAAIEVNRILTDPWNKW